MAPSQVSKADLETSKKQKRHHVHQPPNPNISGRAANLEQLERSAARLRGEISQLRGELRGKNADLRRVEARLEATKHVGGGDAAAPEAEGAPNKEEEDGDGGPSLSSSEPVPAGYWRPVPTTHRVHQRHAASVQPVTSVERKRSAATVHPETTVGRKRSPAAVQAAKRAQSATELRRQQMIPRELSGSEQIMVSSTVAELVKDPNILLDGSTLTSSRLAHIMRKNRCPCINMYDVYLQHVICERAAKARKLARLTVLIHKASETLIGKSAKDNLNSSLSSAMRDSGFTKEETASRHLRKSVLDISKRKRSKGAEVHC